MKKGLKLSLLRLFLREASRVAKDHSLLLTLLIAPLLYAFFYGSIYLNKGEQNVKLAVVDDDRSNISRLLLQNIDNSPMAEVVYFNNLADAREQMYQGNCQGYLYIPNGMQRTLLQLKQANVVLALNASRFLPSSDLLMAVQQICITVGAGIRLQYFEKTAGINTATAMQQVMPVNLDYRPLFNDNSSYGNFLLPGLLALILQQTLLIGLAESMAGERQHLQTNYWLSNNIGSLIWGKGLFYFILFAAYAFFFININYNILNLPMRANGFQLAGLFFLFFAALIPMAQLIGSFFKSQLLCLQVMAFSTYPIFLITGYTWPFESLPLILQMISNLLPTTPFLKIYTAMVQSGAGIFTDFSSLFHLIFLWIFYNTVCHLRLGWLKRRIFANGEKP